MFFQIADLAMHAGMHRELQGVVAVVDDKAREHARCKQMWRAHKQVTV